MICISNGFVKNQNQLIEFRLSSSKLINIPIYQFFKFSDLIQQNENVKTIISSMQATFSRIIESKTISDESIEIFSKLILEEKVNISPINYWDLYQLSLIFQVKALQTVLDQYASDHSNDFDFILNLLIEREKVDEIESKLPKNYRSSHIEDIFVNKVNECFHNKLFDKVPISVIYRIIEKSNENEIDNDSLFEFINHSIGNRFILFQFLKVSKLSDSSFKTLSSIIFGIAIVHCYCILLTCNSLSFFFFSAMLMVSICIFENINL